jgi:DNA gyrase/topoisomerase IV subunit A
VDARERDSAETRLTLLEAVLSALERRQDVVETVWAARDRKEAAAGVRELLGLPEGVPPEVVLDMQFSRLTAESRASIAAEVAHLRGLLVDGS